MPLTLADLSNSECVGKRVEIPVHYNAWARGARFGRVTRYGRPPGASSNCVWIKLDHPAYRTRLKVWVIDFAFCKVVE